MDNDNEDLAFFDSGPDFYDDIDCQTTFTSTLKQLSSSNEENINAHSTSEKKDFSPKNKLDCDGNSDDFFFTNDADDAWNPTEEPYESESESKPDDMKTQNKTKTSVQNDWLTELGDDIDIDPVSALEDDPNYSLTSDDDDDYVRKRKKRKSKKLPKKSDSSSKKEKTIASLEQTAKSRPLKKREKILMNQLSKESIMGKSKRPPAKPVILDADGRTRYRCTYDRTKCWKYFYNLATLQAHLLRHTERKGMPGEEKLVRCKDCHVWCTSEESYTHHIRKRHLSKWFIQIQILIAQCIVNCKISILVFFLQRIPRHTIVQSVITNTKVLEACFDITKRRIVISLNMCANIVERHFSPLTTTVVTYDGFISKS